MRVFNTLAVFTASLMFYSCAAPVFSVKSNEKGSDFFMGREYVEKVNSSARITINFEEQDKDLFIFYIKVKSVQDSVFIFDPGEIYADVLEPETKPEYFKLYALDPESEIGRINKSINTANAIKAGSDGVTFIVAAVDIISEVATIGKKKSEEEVVNKQIARENFWKVVEANDINYHNTIADLNDEKDFWQNNVLRKSTLRCGDSVKGFFYLPYWSKTKLFRIVVPTGEKKHMFTFKQIKE